ncbi:hypothetical protein VKT23_014734 [Stygiomarasmius scandens]|uniref:Heterokaryon incompatibility domain-containing protein n=1 Tax=Marasmiellus scandens TaxID=2682957 RepID=A0ABR1IZJ2_9AGAR
MRLLRTSTDEPVLQYFGSGTPPYAILSHTWGDDEVLFQDVMNGARRDAKKREGGVGWQKMEASRRFAREHGFEYIWNDTCCIDKESSAELTESINSMYKYYEESELCVAYISDVPGNLELSVRKKKLKRSRWFSRGWTLQELVAPRKVIFVDAEWMEIGFKSSMQELIREATGISSKGLRNPLSSEISVAARMSWAARRETTREEDMAYCLMGLFQVNMPPLYGEGSYRAFLRLQLEIIKLSGDRSIFAWRASSNNLKHRGLLANSPQEFLGSGTVRFTGESRLGMLENPGDHEPMYDERCMKAFRSCVLSGCSWAILCYICSDDARNRREEAQQARILEVDPTYTMANAVLHTHFPFRYIGTAQGSLAAVFLSCFLDESDDNPLWISVQNFGNRQFQRVEADRFCAGQGNPHQINSDLPLVQQMYFQQPALDRYTSRIWITLATKCMFVVRQSLESIGTYKFVRNTKWHPAHSSGEFFCNSLPAPTSSWCLPFYDAANQRGFVISVRVDLSHSIFCGISLIDPAPTETDIINAVKSYWEVCMFNLVPERESRGDRTFLVIDEGIVSVLVHNVTKSFAWKAEETRDMEIFNIEITSIHDSTLHSLLKVPPALQPDDSANLVWQMSLNQDYRLTLYRASARQANLGDRVKLVSIPRDNLPMLMTLHGSFGQVGIMVGMEDTKVWVDIITEPEYGHEKSFPDRQKVNDAYVGPETRGRGQESVSGQWHSKTDSSESIEQEILVKTEKSASPIQFGSFIVSVDIRSRFEYQEATPPPSPS